MRTEVRTRVISQQYNVYIANDGTEFSSSIACENYEEENKKIEVEEIIMNRPWKDGGLKPEHFKDKRITPNSLADRIKESFSRR